MLLRAENFYAANSIALRVGTVAERIDCDARIVVLTGGTPLLATSHARHGCAQPSAGHSGLRRSHVTGISHACPCPQPRGAACRIRHITIAGRGFIGFEVASLLRSHKIEVDVIETSDRLIGRVLSPVISDYFRQFHTKAGVRLRFRNAIRSVGKDAAREVVALADSTTINTEAIMMAVGVLPNDALAAAARLEVNDGIVVDAHQRSRNLCDRGLRRSSEPVPQRPRTAGICAERDRPSTVGLTGSPAPYRSLPWFWFDQGGAHLQIAGLTVDPDSAVLRGERRVLGFPLQGRSS
ncbi:FAD-dependent oxidoreductase [Bradyrhizobium sp. BEA-2-5]|nr:FAD-dependent oxidoreductase [Bradyrhizobium sp. BEA-2-5]WOH80439.1 FAD-dependent oxidoreductase [Bradyrhizobium sp. BEA-2-5]